MRGLFGFEASVDAGEEPEGPWDGDQYNPCDGIPICGLWFGEENVEAEEDAARDYAEEEEGGDNVYSGISLPLNAVVH